jgi:Glycosyltransferase
MTTDAVGGIWQYTLDLTMCLREQGIQVILAVLGPEPSLKQSIAAGAAGAQMLLTGLPLDWTAETQGEMEEAGRRIAELAESSEADIVHLNSPALAGAAKFTIPVVAVCHSCVATWWRSVRTGPLPEDFVWRTEFVRRGYSTASLLLAPSKAFAQETKETYGLDRLPRVVRNGRRHADVAGYPDTRPSAFTAGRLWDEGKNFAVLDRAAACLSIPVLAAGPTEGPDGTSIKALHAQMLGILSDSEVAYHLSARPIFVSAARYEPFGLAVLEAAQAGCPLVLSDIPTFRELWGEVAIFVPADDSDAFARAIEMLASDGEKRCHLGRMAKEHARIYSADAMCSGVMAAYYGLWTPGQLPSHEDAAA